MTTSLISRLEAATGPDRGLDGMIARDVAGWHPHFDLKGYAILEWPDLAGHWHTPTEGKCRGVGECSPDGGLEPPAYTGSLDAAMTLVPEGCAYQIRRNVSPDGDEAYCNAQVWPYEGLRRDDDEPDEPHCFGNHDADKPAIALCLAALKARGIGSGE